MTLQNVKKDQRLKTWPCAKQGLTLSPEAFSGHGDCCIKRVIVNDREETLLVIIGGNRCEWDVNVNV